MVMRMREVTRIRRRRLRTLLTGAMSIAVLLGLAALQGSVAQAIANGEPVPEGRYRFSVKLTMTGIPTPDGGRRNSACSGALIASDWIITAGHCFRDVNGVRVDRPVADLTTATVGRADLSGTNGHVRTVVAVRQSPTNDMALAKLDRPVRDIRPLALATSPPRVGDVLRVTGYGALNSDVIVPSTILQTGQVTVVGLDASRIGVTGFAPARDTSACPFDSGAPYFVEGRGGPKLVSVENTGPDCPHADVEVTARVDNIVKWIRSVIK
jgi:secreted trypsin-like serine protease